MKKNIIIILILCLNVLFSQFVINNREIQGIGKGNSEYVIVLLEKTNNLPKLIEYVNKNKLNMSHSISEKDKEIVYQIKNYDPYNITNNKYDKGLNDFGVKTNFFEKNVRTMKLKSDYVFNGISSYIITSESEDYEKLQKSLQEVGFNANLVQSIEFGNIDFIFDIIVVLAISILLISFIIEYNTQKKKMSILKLHSSFFGAFSYLYLNKLLVISGLSILLIIVFKVFFDVDNFLLIKNIGLFITVIWGIALILCYGLSKKIDVSELKGKMNLKIPFNIFRALSIIMMILISCTGYFLVGKQEDSISITQQKSKWSLSKHYVNLTLNNDLIDIGFPGENINSIYNVLNINGAIYFDNNEFSNYEYEMYGVTSNKKIKDVEVDNKSAIMVNSNYLKEYNMIKYKKESDINILIPNSMWNQSKNILENRCFIEKDEKKIKITNCQATKIEDRKAFVGAKLDDKEEDGMFNSIIVVYSDNFLNKYLDVTNQALYLKYDVNKSYSENYGYIMKIINDKDVFSENGTYNDISNISLEYSDILKIMAQSQQIIKTALLIFWIVTVYFIYNIISIYISSTIKEIAIKKISGYSMLIRYQSLLIFMIFCSFISTSLIWLYLLVSKRGSLTIGYLIFIGIVNLLIIVVSHHMIKKLERKSILNILKGDSI